MTTTTQANSLRKITIWIWPRGLYPRSLIYYFRAKRLSHAILKKCNIHLVPVILDKSAGSLVSKPDYEARPAGTLPCLRSEISGTEDLYILETTAILNYLEEIFSVEKSLPDLRGVTPEQRARSGDVLSVVVSAAHWHALHLVNSDPSTLFWSGLRRDQWSEHMADYAKTKKNDLLSKVEDWMEKNFIRNGCRSISGEGANVTLADLSLMMCIEYDKNTYGNDWVVEHGLLRVWYENAKKEDWFIGREGLKALEDDKFEGLFVTH